MNCASSYRVKLMRIVLHHFEFMMQINVRPKTSPAIPYDFLLHMSRPTLAAPPGVGLVGFNYENGDGGGACLS